MTVVMRQARVEGIGSPACSTVEALPQENPVTKALAILCLSALVSACALPQNYGPARVCVPDSAICDFPDS